MYQSFIIEDDPQVAQLNCDYLERAGFAVAGTAADAKSALAKLQETSVQLVLLDIYLPGCNGLQILREIRAGQRQIDIIIISAAKDSTQIREAFRMGCLDYIIKPFTYERLHNALKKYEQKMDLLKKDFLNQTEVDLLTLPQNAGEEDSNLPKGIDRNTLKQACCCVLKMNRSFGVQDIADGVHLSRVSAKKYLDFLCEQKILQQTYIYGNKGRPANLYQVSYRGASIIRSRLALWPD